MLNRILQTTVAFLLVFMMACDSNSSNGEMESRYFEFTSGDESINYSFIAKTSDPEVIGKIEEELERPLDERTLHINGNIERGDGGHNSDWSWHFTPNEWDMVEMSVEVCDGRPQMVEDSLDYWVDQVGYFCPWSSRIAGEVEAPAND